MTRVDGSWLNLKSVDAPEIARTPHHFRRLSIFHFWPHAQLLATSRIASRYPPTLYRSHSNQLAQFYRDELISFPTMPGNPEAEAKKEWVSEAAKKLCDWHRIDGDVLSTKDNYCALSIPALCSNFGNNFSLFLGLETRPSLQKNMMKQSSITQRQFP